MKKIICVLLTALMTLSIVSCGEATDTDITETKAENETVKETDEEGNGEALSDTADATETETENETEIEEELDMVYPADLEKIVLANSDIYSWWKTYNFAKTDSDPFWQNKDLYFPVPVTFSWEADEDADYYRLYLSTDEDFAVDKTESYLVNTNSLTLNDLFTGTQYYWTVLSTDASDGTEKNTTVVAIRSFTTEESPRCLMIEGVSNTRDIGGITMKDGTRIKQGMIYRGGKLEDITEEGKDYFLNHIGIKTDLDLRTPGEGGAGIKSPLGDDVNYVNINGRYYIGNMGISTDEGKAVFAEEIRLFTKKENYPIYIHCSLGRDRTGTLAFVIEALLGVNKNMLIMDYELSVFSVTGTLDNAGVTAIKNNILATYNYIDQNYEGQNFAEKTENYLLSIGITAEEIQTIRDLLLEEVK